MSWQELADEAFRDLLKKHGRPTDLRSRLEAEHDFPDERREHNRPAARRNVRREACDAVASAIVSIAGTDRSARRPPAPRRSR